MGARATRRRQPLATKAGIRWHKPVKWLNWRVAAPPYLFAVTTHQTDLKILIITSWYPNRVHPQDGNFVRSQAKAAARTNAVELMCVVADPELVGGAGPQVQVTVEEGRLRVIRAHYAARGNQLQRRLRRRAAWKAAAERRQMSPDLIHAHVLIDGGIIAHRLASKLNVPFIVTEHSHRYLRPWPLRRQPELWLARKAARSAARIIAVSPALRRGMRDLGIPGNYTVIPNVIEEELFYPHPPDHSTPFTFLHVSDFSDNKNLADLLTAFARLSAAHPHTRLHIAGNGDFQQLSSLVQSLHPRPRHVQLSGPHAPAAIAELMRTADAFVLCSTLETQSLVLIEALLSGIPCIASTCGGPENILSGKEDGVLYPTGNLEALYAAMTGFVTRQKVSLTDRQQRSQRNRRRFGSAQRDLQALYHRITARE